MRISRDQAEGGQSSLRNSELSCAMLERGLTLEFGNHDSQREQQYLTAVSLIIVDAQGESAYLNSRAS